MKLDWSLLHCARNGHVTYRPTEEPLAERLSAQTVAGDAWRCLRCGAYVPGEPHGSGPADAAPSVPRGKALRDVVIIRLLAVERAIKGTGLLLLAFAVWRFKNVRESFAQTVHDELPLLQPAAERVGWNLQDSWIAELVQRIADVEKTTLSLVAVGLLAYGLLQWAESVGLWLGKRWGEYLAVVATSAFLPIEIHELMVKVSLFKGTLLAVNIAAVIWLVYSKRLFGVRGGHAAMEAQNHSESLISVERAALVAGTPKAKPTSVS